MLPFAQPATVVGRCEECDVPAGLLLNTTNTRAVLSPLSVFIEDCFFPTAFEFPCQVSRALIYG